MANFYKKSNQLGRSMIEMLGVLAIIGVLSIASISAYSRAMFKYQLNQYTEDFSLLLSNAISLLPKLRQQNAAAEETYANLNSTLAEISAMPASMHYDDKSGYIYDVFKNQNQLDYNQKKSQGKTAIAYRLIVHLARSGDRVASRDREICRNIMLVAKENALDIYTADMYATSGSGSSSLIGDLAHGSSKRLRNAGLVEIDAVCNSCVSEHDCSVVIYMYGG